MRFGEALAAAGFDCYSIDAAGYGESPLPVSSLSDLEANLFQAERALGPVDVFVGHSMGGFLGGWSVRRAGFRPKLFVGLGSPQKLSEHGPPELLLGGLFDELVRPAHLHARTEAEVALGLAGAFGWMFCLPELHPRLAALRPIIVPGALLLPLILTLGPWMGLTSRLRRIPAHLFVLAVVWLALVGAGRLRMPRWSLAVATGTAALGCWGFLTLTNNFLCSIFVCALVISTLWLLPATAVGRIATRGGSKRDGDIAMTILRVMSSGNLFRCFTEARPP